MVQETTSAAGDRRGSANPTWSKTRQRAFEGGPPELAGRSHEGVGNGTPRWMIANRVVVRRRGEQNPAYEPAHPHLGAGVCSFTVAAFGAAGSSQTGR